MIRVLTALLLLICGFAAHAEEKMLFVEYRVISAQISPSSPDAHPRKLWRVGSKYMRFEDAPNPKTKVHGLIIVDEPNIWIIDRYKNQGQHTVDPGPSYAIHFPMFPNENSEKLKQLEFGQELEFFEDNGAKEVPAQTVDGVTCRLLRLEIDEREVTLFLNKDNTPFQVEVKVPTNSYALRFLKYVPDQKPDYRLFELPPGVELLKKES